MTSEKRGPERGLSATKPRSGEGRRSPAEVRTAQDRREPGARSAANRGVLRSHLAAHGGALYAFLARLWATLMWLGLIALVVARLSPEVQGYFFTFSSLLLLQVFLEVGFPVVLLQFVSHEWAFLRFGPRGQIEGSPAAAARLASLVRLCREAGRPSSATSNVSFPAATPLLRPLRISVA